MECFKYEIKPNPKILKELQDRKMFNSDLHLKHVDFMHTAVIDSFPTNLKCNSNLLNIIKYCIQGYFALCYFHPSTFANGITPSQIHQDTLVY